MRLSIGIKKTTSPIRDEVVSRYHPVSHLAVSALPDTFVSARISAPWITVGETGAPTGGLPRVQIAAPEGFSTLLAGPACTIPRLADGFQRCTRFHHRSSRLDYNTNSSPLCAFYNPDAHPFQKLTRFSASGSVGGVEISPWFAEPLGGHGGGETPVGRVSYPASSQVARLRVRMPRLRRRTGQSSCFKASYTA